VIPREGVESLPLTPSVVFSRASSVIPREGVESNKPGKDCKPLHQVIPREGVERPEVLR